MKHQLKITVIVLFVIAAFSSCKKDKLRPVNQEELITSIKVSLIDSASGLDTAVLSFRDLDGEGGEDPVISADTLHSNTTYNAAIVMLDESQLPVSVVSDEILEEGTAHQFFYQSDHLNLFLYFSYTDTDANGLPIGLSFRAKTAVPGNGFLTISLRHQPEKTGPGVSSGDITNAFGETDAEVSFPVIIQ